MQADAYAPPRVDVGRLTSSRGSVLLFEKTLKVGDFVELESGLVGRVAEIDTRYTRITTNDLVDVIVPNSELTENRASPLELWRANPANPRAVRCRIRY